MKVAALFLFLFAWPLDISLAEEGPPCEGNSGDISTTPSSVPSSTPSSNEPSSVAGQVGLTGGTCRECDNPLGPNPWDRSDRICSPECDPDGHLFEEGFQAFDEALSNLETAVDQVVAALANFPSYQYDASYASVPSLQGH